MDTTELYIKMADCPEIQERKPSFATRIHTKKNIFICSDYDGGLGGICWAKDTFNDEDRELIPEILGDLINGK